MLHHLFSPTTFWTEYPLPSLPLDHEKYAELQESNWTYWNYCTSPRTTRHVVDGLLWVAKTLDPSITGKAAILLDKYTRLHFTNGDVQRPNIAEPMFENLDYNHSSRIDIVIQLVADIIPQETCDTYNQNSPSNPSAEFVPTQTLNCPGSTTYCMSAS